MATKYQYIEKPDEEDEKKKNVDMKELDGVDNKAYEDM